MEVLIASTKKVEEDNEGFQLVSKRNKGNNMGVHDKEEMGKKNQVSVQGQNGNYQGKGKSGDGINAGSQGQKGNNGSKLGNNNGGNQWNKGKAVQGYNGKNYSKNGNFFGGKLEQGQSSKSNFFVKKENIVGDISVEKNKQKSNLKVELGKKEGNVQKYIPKSGPDIKISSNFDKENSNIRKVDTMEFVSKNKFDVLMELKEENQYGISKKGIADIDLDYLDTVDQMEVIGGIPLLQLITSVLLSLPVFWASSILIPISIIKDIEKLMKNFLWNHDESKKGRAKVAWTSICKPVVNGGLGIRSLRMWNKAIISKRIWMILSDFDSLWVKWVKINLLKGRSFWDIEKKNGLSWSWRNLIKLKDAVRNHFCNKIGDGASSFIWFDDWHPLGPLSYVISPREISQAGFSISDKVRDVIVDDSWFWPNEWCDIIPQLRNFQLPFLNPSIPDKVMWRSSSGRIIDFSIKRVCDDLSNFGNEVSWVHLVWFKQRIPRHSFILWLAVQERLMTQDRMRFWDKNKNLYCVLCNKQPDSHSHLFFECSFSNHVWEAVKDKTGIISDSHGWKELIEELQEKFKGKSILVFITKIAFAASVYYIWRERNRRLFRKGKSEESKVMLEIFEEIRLKLIGLKGDYLGFDNVVKKKWGVPVGEKNQDHFDD
ncbi:unnamed protein product [Lactuca saligna]|uniref:Reverse transcriptase zinc-binding domain-containing protein n=1 Tax=Lactuca saligna TaxID=75948 RepID=A0AA35ZA17_LACSI|nr:unnamed protein product [Lactuca saligna]